MIGTCFGKNGHLFRENTFHKSQKGHMTLRFNILQFVLALERYELKYTILLSIIRMGTICT